MWPGWFAISVMKSGNLAAKPGCEVKSMRDRGIVMIFMAVSLLKRAPYGLISLMPQSAFAHESLEATCLPDHPTLSGSGSYQGIGL